MWDAPVDPAPVAPSGRAADPQRKESEVLDVVYVVAVLAVFALIGLVARAVEKL